MSIVPEGEQLRKAIKWISEEQEKSPGLNPLSLIGDACLKFDIAPKDEEFLLRFFTKKHSEKSE